MIPAFKLCCTCKQEKPSDAFHKNARKKDGLHNQCKLCRRVHYDANRDRILAYNISWNNENRETIKTHNQKRVTSTKGRARQLWNGAKLRAAAKGLAFEITRDWVELALMVGTCQRTGLRFDLSSQSKYNFNPLAPSLDKKDPFGGYTFENVQVVITAYNIGKGQLTDAEFFTLCQQVVDYRK